jgi:chorismate mutase
MKNRKVTSYLMDIIHYKEFETIPGRATDGVPASPLSARRCLQNAAPRLSPATCFRPAEAGHRNNTKVRSLWTTVRALFRGLFSPPSTQDLKPTPRVSVILTPVGLLVYEWHQIDSLDQRIVELIQRRARAVEEVGNIKREAHLPVTVPKREQQVIEKAQEFAKGGPLPAEAVGRIYQKLVEEMRNWEATLGAAAPQSSSQPAAEGGSK